MAAKRLASSALGKLPPPRRVAAVQTLRFARAFVRGETVPVPRPDLRERLTRAFAVGDGTRIAATLGELHELQALAARLASPPWTPPDVCLAEAYGTQSLQFMIDLLPHIQRLLAEQKRWSRFDVLDVGPGTGHGTALLASLYRGNRLGYQMNVSALDISRQYERYIPAITPHVPFIRENVFDHQRRYDIVIASHVIEHLSDPVPFVRRLQEIARLAVFIVAPFNEPADNLTRGHVTIVDEQLVKELDPVEWHTMHSVSWGAFVDPPYEMLIARLAGTADA
jgi:SAM-dependent methyltransferase